ncbi:MAG TPA: hypothetical protein VKC64_18370 [Burkholderiales bacterium]|nr:hypothetical protein [Burkholderiales bacterium]
MSAQHQLRATLRRALALRQWAELDEVERELADSPALAARFIESLHHVLETPELAAREPGARWHGLVLAIPVSIASRSGGVFALPEPLALVLRESLQARFPPGTGIRLVNRLVPQLVARSMPARSRYELVEELASGERAAAAAAEVSSTSGFVPHGGSLGQHYLFALALTAHPEQLALEMAGDLHAAPGLVRWAAAQTERMTSDFAERGWPLLIRVSAPQRLSEMLSSPLLLVDVRELDGLLNHVSSRHGTPLTMLRVDLALKQSEETRLQITISDRRVATPLAHGLYRISALGPEAGAYRVAVRLASAGVELATADENLVRAVQRAIALTSETEPSAPPRDGPASPPIQRRTLRSRFSRSARPN